MFQSIPLISTFITRRMDIWDDVRSYSMSNFFSPLSFLRHRALFFFSRFFFYLSFFCSYFYLQFMCAFFVRLSEKQREKETSRIHGSVSDGGEMSGLRHYLSRRLYSHLRERGWTYTHTHKKKERRAENRFFESCIARFGTLDVVSNFTYSWCLSCAFNIPNVRMGWRPRR